MFVSNKTFLLLSKSIAFNSVKKKKWHFSPLGTHHMFLYSAKSQNIPQQWFLYCQIADSPLYTLTYSLTIFTSTTDIFSNTAKPNLKK